MADLQLSQENTDYSVQIIIYVLLMLNMGMNFISIKSSIGSINNTKVMLLSRKELMSCILKKSGRTNSTVFLKTLSYLKQIVTPINTASKAEFRQIITSHYIQCKEKIIRHHEIRN